MLSINNICFSIIHSVYMGPQAFGFHVCEEDFQHKLRITVFYYYNKYEIFLHKIYTLRMIHSCSLDSSACNILVGGISSS